jgi:hypothetical protein
MSSSGGYTCRDSRPVQEVTQKWIAIQEGHSSANLQAQCCDVIQIVIVVAQFRHSSAVCALNKKELTMAHVFTKHNEPHVQDKLEICVQ